MEEDAWDAIGISVHLKDVRWGWFAKDPYTAGTYGQGST